ncbi:DUF4177 domain-containing protein [Aliiroseovarius sp. 2305UL8-7]|uniref:DUF4177 domain-containing protein n=1 Tax=Aliiroseovarius conchicola TaxID=3121637 RepID=UPI0035274629
MFEYEVIPAPRKGKKARGVKTSEARFAHVMAEILNEMAAEGWEYQRTDTLPSEERSGLTGRTTVYHNMLVFRRALDVEVEADEVAEAPLVEAPVAPVEENPAPALPSAAEANEVSDHAPAVERTDNKSDG